MLLGTYLPSRLWVEICLKVLGWRSWRRGGGRLDKCIDGATWSVYCTSMATTQAAVSVDDPYALRPDCTDSAPPRFRIKVGWFWFLIYFLSELFFPLFVIPRGKISLVEVSTAPRFWFGIFCSGLAVPLVMVRTWCVLASSSISCLLIVVTFFED